MVSNRGTKVFPVAGAVPSCVDHWRCRYVLRDPAGTVDDRAVIELLGRVGAAFRWMHVEKLEEHDGKAAYTKAQGED